VAVLACDLERSDSILCGQIDVSSTIKANADALYVTLIARDGQSCAPRTSTVALVNVSTGLDKNPCAHSMAGAARGDQARIVLLTGTTSIESSIHCHN
jgi:hypothetical protein